MVRTADHVEGCFGCVVSIVATSLAFMSKRDAARLARNQDDLGSRLEQTRVDELVDDEDGRYGAGCVHGHLFLPVGALVEEVFRGEAASGNDLGIVSWNEHCGMPSLTWSPCAPPTTVSRGFSPFNCLVSSSATLGFVKSMLDSHLMLSGKPSGLDPERVVP